MSRPRSILFVMRNPVYARNFERPLQLLAERGHRIRIAFEQDKTGFESQNDLVQRLVDAYPKVAHGRAPGHGGARSYAVADELRMTRNYLRYLEPPYEDAHKLRARAERHAPAAARAFADSPLARSAAVRHALDRRLAGLESRIPTTKKIDRFLERSKADLLVVTPLMGFHSAQPDYVRSARALGIPSALCVFSWDNLTNKGLMHEVPDLVTVWNEAQRNEAVQLHGVPLERVAITGAVAYDHWFDWRPSTSAGEFVAKVGLPACRPYLLYMCSSAFIAPDELSFVREWVTQLRARGGDVSRCSVLVRPHPMNGAQWTDADLTDLRDVAIYPRTGGEPRDTATRDDFYNSIHHAVAVVGLNTSAQIESAIVDRPVHTVLTDRYRDTQGGTVHFAHLRDGQLLQVAEGFDEHHAQLEASIAEPSSATERNRRFLTSFVRPHGLDVAASPRLADELETLAGTRRRPQNGPTTSPVHRRPLRSRGGAPARKHEPKRDSPDQVIEALERRLDRALEGDGPVVAGPWLSEVGFELLYWVPFLRWAMESRPGLRERLIVLSRGGTASWYEGLAANYVDVFDLVDVERYATERAVAKQKQRSESPFERELVKAAGAQLGHESVANLHPSQFYSTFMRLMDIDAGAAIYRTSSYAPIATPAVEPGLAALLPDDYIAVRFYYSFALPDTEANRGFIADAIRALAETTNVVLMNPGLRIDDHVDFDAGTARRIHSVEQLVTPANNLDIQTQVVSRARAFVGTYGGLSYLPCFMGVPALCFYSRPDRFNGIHLDVAHRIFSGGEPWGDFMPMHAGHIDLMRAASAAGSGKRLATGAS